jgi:DNA-binding transcriptional regulator YbjK
VAITPKGEVRRDALLDAVLRVLGRDGPGAVTHRSVAAEAGLPLASATYYFATLDELYLSALRRATHEQLALFADIAAGELAEFAAVIHSWVFANRGAALAQYELMFLAMRRTALRAEAELWYGALERAIDPAGRRPAAARVAALAVDGLLLKMLWLGEPSTVAEVEAALREIADATGALG